jgi:hypothetical protein
MDLPFDDHRIDARAAIIEREEPPDFGDAAVDVDIDDADIGTMAATNSSAAKGTTENPSDGSPG